MSSEVFFNLIEVFVEHSAPTRTNCKESEADCTSEHNFADIETVRMFVLVSLYVR